MRMNEFGEYVTIQAVAERFDLTPNAVYLFLRKHRVPCRRAGRTLMVRLSDLSLADMRVPLRVVLAIRDEANKAGIQTWLRGMDVPTSLSDTRQSQT